MNAVSERALVDLVIGWVKENKLHGSSHGVEISADTNLLESGLLDSFAFVDLLLFLENRIGEKIDLLDVEPEQFTVVKGLCLLAMRNAPPRNGADPCATS